MTILYTSAAPVKNTSFGRGLFAYVPSSYRAPYTVADADEAREMFIQDEIERAERERAEARRIRLAAGEAAFMANYENGLSSW